MYSIYPIYTVYKRQKAFLQRCNALRKKMHAKARGSAGVVLPKMRNAAWHYARLRFCGDLSEVLEGITLIGLA